MKVMAHRDEFPSPTIESRGLTGAEALTRLRQYGPNEVTTTRPHPLAAFALKFWAPVPWMLEATAVLELALGKWLEAMIVGIILVLNALIGFVQEGRAQAAIELLRARLAVSARVLRNGTWTTIPARELVPGDVIHVRMGDLVPADLALADGHLLIDQSVLTGESVAVELEPPATAFSGATVVRGEATGEVSATGSRTSFGRTAELVSGAHAQVHLEGVVFRVVKAFILLDFVLALIGSTYLAANSASAQDVVSFAVVLLLASVPVALPAAFTLAGALGSRHLASAGVLTARLSAIQEAAAMDVLCIDKTGTVTQNRLEVAATAAVSTTSTAELLRLAAEASEPSAQDPIDLAILRAANAEPNTPPLRQRQAYTPFDPATKRSEAVVSDGSRTVRVTKGAPQVIAKLIQVAAPELPTGLRSDVEHLAAQGMRVLAVAFSEDGGPWCEAGLIGLADPVRPDAAELIQAVHALGVRVVMVTGDTLATGRAVASTLAIPGDALPASAIRDDRSLDGCGVLAEVLPEDKLRFVQRLQARGHIVGMTGDGVNDAPALRQAEVGIAVAGATDVAKSAAAVVLTREGLVDIVALIKESRRIYQRSLTYALNVSMKKIEVPVVLTIGVLAWQELIFTPLLMALLMILNDMVSLAITTDRVSYSRHPDRWHVRALLAAAAIVTLPLLACSMAILWTGRNVWPAAGLSHLQAIVFLTLVLSSQATIYLVRERSHAWASLPGPWLLAASAVDVTIVIIMALAGLLIDRLSLSVVAAVVGTVFAAAVLTDFVKVHAFRVVGLDRHTH